jgi:hypothetical protein
MIKQLQLASGMVLLGLLALLAMANPAAAQTRRPIEVAQALAAAQNANDAAAMRALIARNATFVQSPGSSQGREAWIAGNTGANNSHVTILNAQQTAPDTVAADATLSGGDIPPLPHPFTVHVVFTVVNERITHGVITLSPQTQQDITATLGPPPAQETPSPVDVALALADAQNANDAAAMRALLAPNARIENDPFMGGGVETRDQFIADNTGAHNSEVAVSNIRQTAPDTVTADAVLTGGDIPANLPHPFLLHVTFTVANGQVTHAKVALDAQTRQDLEALGPPPGMPTTGQPAGWLLPGGLGLLALVLGLGGLALRRRRFAR